VARVTLRDMTAEDDFDFDEEKRLRSERARLNVARAVDVLVTAVRTVGGFAAAVLAAYIVLSVGGANPDNTIAKFVARWADVLALGFRDLFTPADPKLQVLVNHGLAALFWLIIASVVSRILRRLTSPYLIS